MEQQLLKRGDKIRIRSKEWFNYNVGGNKLVGRFTTPMSYYCGFDSTIKECYYEPSLKGFGYKLDLFEEDFHVWQDYMFEPISIVSNYVRVRDYCSNICSLSCSNNDKFYSDLCPLSNLDLFKIGDKVKIRSLDWFQFSGRFVFFTTNMIEYCSKEATIVDILHRDVNLYMLDIDNKRYYWQDYMFEVPSPSSSLLDSIYTNLCKIGCLYECRGSKCLLFKYKSK